MTLRRRIVAGVALIIALCLGVAFVTVHHYVRSQLQDGIDQDLRGDMDAFASALGRRGDSATVARQYIASQPFKATARLLYAARPGEVPVTNETSLLDADDRWLFGTAPGLSTLPVSDVGGLRLLVTRAEDGTLLGVGEPVESVDRALTGVDSGLLIATALALLIAVAAGTGLSLGVTRPLRRLARVAQDIDGGDLTPRMRAGGPPDEVRALADALDTMLDRVEAAFIRERVFVAEASHELRTPLTVIRGQLEVLAADPNAGRADIERVERLVTAEVTHMTRLVDDLLVLAAPTVRIEDVRLQPLLEELAEAFAATTDRSLSVACPPDVALRADPDRLGQAVRNVLANALRHSRSTVTVHAEREGTRVRIAVDDDGPGVPEAEWEHVFDRFHRVAPRAGSKGAGLGLAIVRAVVEGSDGRVWMEASPDLGGARVCLELPAAAGPT
jgi:signal transduction histidine kinase